VTYYEECFHSAKTGLEKKVASLVKRSPNVISDKTPKDMLNFQGKGTLLQKITNGDEENLNG
jgi:hypothetical protein